MTDEIHELLHSMNKRLTDLTGEMRDMRRSMDAQLGLIRNQMIAFTGFQRLQDETIQQLRERIERLERRADLAPDEGQ